MCIGETKPTAGDVKRADALRFTERDAQLFMEGSHSRLFEKLGAHICVGRDVSNGSGPTPGCFFSLWAPGASAVYVVGCFNNWESVHEMELVSPACGIWSLFVAGVGTGALYKYRIVCKNGEVLEKSDPMAFEGEAIRDEGRMFPPASRVTDLSKHTWQDSKRRQMKSREDREDRRSKPMAVYEVHLGSFLRRRTEATPSPTEIACITGACSMKSDDPREHDVSRRASGRRRDTPVEATGVMDTTNPYVLGSIGVGICPVADRGRPERTGTWLSYEELGREIGCYAKAMGFTAVELLPIMEHPFYGSWGYQVTGFFAPTSRYGRVADLMAMIETLHSLDMDVYLDWVPAHFSLDEHGLIKFCGEAQYEYINPMRGMHPDWGTAIFNYSLPQVQSFLLSSARFWLDVYHVDGLRVDAVASMLYYSYSRPHGEWIGNEDGSEENWDAVRFFQKLNSMVHNECPACITIAEESSGWPQVTGRVNDPGAMQQPGDEGGSGNSRGMSSGSSFHALDKHKALGFDFKWDLGWMNDTLQYFSKDPIHRSFPDSHSLVTQKFTNGDWSGLIFPLSHDEVVHGKHSLLGRMPGRGLEDRLSHWRTLLAYQYGCPGKKLLFMGQEFAQWQEWQHEQELCWYLPRDVPLWSTAQRWTRALNQLYRTNRALHDCDSQAGFQWIDKESVEHSMLAFIRWSRSKKDAILAVYNFTPVARDQYQMMLPFPVGTRCVVLACSDAQVFGGEGSSPISGCPEATVGSIGLENFEQPTFFTVPLDETEKGIGNTINGMSSNYSSLHLHVPGATAAFLKLCI
mmetsp:Transcript_13124/g.47876  ORF Transcript_13124/g.47876 Transcript_13124/m.47876 type:complete len:802 (+) Transcript_13124:292-2697(+)